VVPPWISSSCAGSLRRAGHVHQEIVHNTYVVEQLRRRGAIFVEAIEEVPHGAVLVFSATVFRRRSARKAKSRELK